MNNCEGCGHLIDTMCNVYMYATQQHTRIGGCAMRTHNRTIKKEAALSKDSIKVSKRKVGVK